ncbi:hypothetical protein [Arthrobacter sp. NPDC090010]|uniref:phosphatase domain-containing protein n=1 Tax=Arthrobacter sp. NPDC090010 TaxID=3363942 RepID=UPI0038052BA5
MEHSPADSPPLSSRTRREAVIFDVDGTLCDVRSIRHLVAGVAGATSAGVATAGTMPGGGVRFKANFDAFHGASIDCPPHPRVVEVLQEAQAEGRVVLVVTGRSEKWSFVTTLWMQEHGISFDELMMRPSGDFRPDSVVKSEIAQRILARYRPVLALDDRDDIIAVWHAAGIPTRKVTLDGEVLAVVVPG